MESTMTREEYFEFHQSMCDSARELSLRKNYDYSGGEDGSNPFQNFQVVEHMGAGVTTEQGFIVRISDKIKRLSGFCKTGEFKVSDESFQDTCEDVINYICLLAAYKASRDKEGGS